MSQIEIQKLKIIITDRNRLEQAEKIISELEDRSMEII